MITCPWCGTNFTTFQPNCKNCGGPLPALEETIGLTDPTKDLLMPPPAPRTISEKYVWRLFFSDGWSIAALILGFMGVIFTLLGVVLTVAVVTAFVGIPFLILGIIFLGICIGLSIWRYKETQKIVNVLREGEATRGQIVELNENYSVSINGRYPWVIRYQFRVNGQDYEGKITTMNQPGPQLQAEKAVCVLYLPTAPELNSIYPHP